MSKLAAAFDLPQTEPAETELPGNPLATELAAQMAGQGISVSDAVWASGPLQGRRYRAAEAKLKEIIDRLLRATAGVTNVQWR